MKLLFSEDIEGGRVHMPYGYGPRLQNVMEEDPL